MSYFDSRVDKGPVWQVVSIRVVKVGIKVNMKVLRVCAKLGRFSVVG